MKPTGEPLASWNDSVSKAAITDYVARVTRRGGSDFVPAEARIAVFDNDGTLWCEKPVPVELGFILERLALAARQDPSVAEQQPWKAAKDKDYAWVGTVVDKHYHGDDSDVKVLMGGILKSFSGMTVEAYQETAGRYLYETSHPTLHRLFTDCGYRPMIELLRYLETHGFSTFIVSGGNRDFMRLLSGQVYGVPGERVVGSSSALCYQEHHRGGVLVYQSEPEVFDDGPVKPVRIWSRIGRRPILAFGNSNGDLQMLQFAGGDRPAMRLLLHHDDKEREFSYTSGAERVLHEASARGWTVVSMRDDWKRVFGRASGPQRRLSGVRSLSTDRRISDTEMHLTD
ncbi:MAG TPA: HAD family hydrolase [Gemmatimonadales bacterium]|nr:HAD family hydrolase [Gemmatimonadales bacterium]